MYLDELNFYVNIMCLFKTAEQLCGIDYLFDPRKTYHCWRRLMIKLL